MSHGVQRWQPSDARENEQAIDRKVEDPLGKDGKSLQKRLNHAPGRIYPFIVYTVSNYRKQAEDPLPLGGGMNVFLASPQPLARESPLLRAGAA